MTIAYGLAFPRKLQIGRGASVHTECMRLTRKKFVLRFLGCGYALDFVAKFLLDQPHDALGAVPSQAPWQQHISTILSPLRLVLVGPVVWLQQDPDPPPPFRVILLAIYWTLLALVAHSLLNSRTRKRAQTSSDS